MGKEPNPQALASLKERVDHISGEIVADKEVTEVVSPLVLRELGDVLAAYDETSNDKLALQIYPLASGFHARFAKFPKATLISNQNLTDDALRRLQSGPLEVELVGWVAQDAVVTLRRLMLKDLRRPRVLGWAIPLAIGTLMATWPGSVAVQGGDPPIQVIGGMISSVSAIFLAVFSFYAGYAHAATGRSPNLLGKHYNEDRVLLAWTLLSLAGSFLGTVLFFVTFSVPTEPSRWATLMSVLNTTTQYGATLMMALAVVFIVPPLVDVIKFLLARQLNLASLELPLDGIRKAISEARDGKPPNA